MYLLEMNDCKLVIFVNNQLDTQLCVKLVIYKVYSEMHRQQNIKFYNAKQAKPTHQYKSIKTKLYKNNAIVLQIGYLQRL